MSYGTSQCLLCGRSYNLYTEKYIYPLFWILSPYALSPFCSVGRNYFVHLLGVPYRTYSLTTVMTLELILIFLTFWNNLYHNFLYDTHQGTNLGFLVFRFIVFTLWVGLIINWSHSNLFIQWWMMIQMNNAVLETSYAVLSSRP